MTVNERLYLAGMIDAFDRALAVRDRDGLVAILQEVYLGEETADAILNRQLRDS